MVSDEEFYFRIPYDKLDLLLYAWENDIVVSEVCRAMDLNEEQGVALSNELGENVIFCRTDVSSESDVQSAIDAAVEKFGSINVAVSAAGILTAGKTVGKKGPYPLENFDKTIKINLLGTFNVIRLSAAKMAENNPDEHGQRGVIINTASVAAFDGQMGQAAYSASKG